MSYTLIDLIDKFTAIEVYLYQIYSELGDCKGIDLNVKTVARVFAREEKRHIKMYIGLKERLEGQKDIDIDFELYDKASKITNTFKESIIKPEVEGIRELLEYILNIEKENKSMIIRIRDILIKSLDQKNTVIYKVLDELLLEEESHVKNLEQFIKG